MPENIYKMAYIEVRMR